MTQYNVATLSHAPNHRRRAMARRLQRGYHLTIGSFFCARLILFVHLAILLCLRFLLARRVFSAPLVALTFMALRLCCTLTQFKTVQGITPLRQLRLDLL